jgi:predicted nucleic acid-binding protein
MNIFIDTSGFLAVLNADDSQHPKAKESWNSILQSDVRLVTTNYVLVETYALLQSRLGMPAVKLFADDIAPVLHVEWVTPDWHKTAMAVLLASSRRKLSFVDCVSFGVMKDLDIKDAFTLDQHFKEQGFLCIP